MPEKLIYSPYRIVYQKDKFEKIKKEGWCFPATLSFLLNDSCNHRCIGCDAIDFKSNKSFPFERVPALIKDLKEMDCMNVEFCGGGEPTLHPDFEKIVKLFYENDFILGLITNGSLIREKIIDTDFLKCFNWIRISLDAATPEMHKRIHGTNDFNQIVQNIKDLVKINKEKNNSKLNISIRFLLYDFNVGDMIQMYNLSENLGVDAVNFRSARNCEHQITPEQAEKYERFLKVLKEESNNKIDVFGTLKKSTLKTKQCYLHWFWAIVTSAGDVLLCCWYQDRYDTHVVGNVFKDNLVNIYKGEKYRKVAEKLNCDKKLLKLCDLYDCRYHKYNEIYEEWLREGDVIRFV
jgi:MoaA/NifB/PqqE/SkfB family radical SAM enzyme